MAKINQTLLNSLKKKLAVGKRQVYNLVAKTVQETYLPRHLAALVLAARSGVNISKFASAEDLDVIQRAVGKTHLVPIQQAPTVRRRTKVAKDLHQPEGVNIDPFVDKQTISAAFKNAELYPTVYMFENSVRKVVATVMQKEFGTD